MFIIAAPYPNIQTTTILPSPDWGDVNEPVATVNALRTMDGTLFTYTKKKDQRRKCHWDFKISRDKSLELKAFITSYFHTRVRIIDHDSVIWIGFLQNNPFEFVGAGAAQSFPGGEVVDISLDFEESDQ
jgi:hypothetical protein